MYSKHVFLYPAGLKEWTCACAGFNQASQVNQSSNISCWGSRDGVWSLLLACFKTFLPPWQLHLKLLHKVKSNRTTWIHCLFCWSNEAVSWALFRQFEGTMCWFRCSVTSVSSTATCVFTYVLYGLLWRDRNCLLLVQCVYILPLYMILRGKYGHEHTHTFTDTRLFHSNWDSLVRRISANNSWVICAPCRPLAFLFNLLSPTACSLINNAHQHVC